MAAPVMDATTVDVDSMK
jgi:mediator of RNA polymerase II transcription subunit 10